MHIAGRKAGFPLSLHGGGSPAAETIKALRKYPVNERRALVWAAGGD